MRTLVLFSNNSLIIELEFSLMIPWMKEIITEVWNSRGNSSSDNESFLVKIISLEGDVLKVAVTPDFKVMKVKSIATEHFYGNDKTKIVTHFRLVHATQLKILSDEKSLGYEKVSKSDELLLNEVRPHIDEPSSKHASRIPKEEQRINATNDLLILREPQEFVPAKIPPRFIEDQYQMMITCVRASAKILMFSENAHNYYDFLKAKLEYLLEPTNENLGHPVTLYCTKDEVENTQLMKSKLGEAVNFEWLFNNKPNLEMGGLHIASANEKAGSSSLNRASRSSIADTTSKILKKPDNYKTCSKSHPNLVHLVDILLDVFLQQQKLYFSPDQNLVTYLKCYKFEKEAIVDALFITGNNFENALAWLNGDRNTNLQIWRNGLDPGSRLYLALMNNPSINLGLGNPEIFLVYLSLLERRKTSDVLIYCSPKVKDHYEAMFRTHDIIREK